jgi:hypothetical protein
MGFSYEEAIDRLECPHNNCGYHQVRTEISGSYVENKLTVEKTCDNCRGTDHLMFDVGSYNTEVDIAEVGDIFEVKDNIRIARSKEGDRLHITTISENPTYIDNPIVSSDDILISVARNLDQDSRYRVGTLTPSRLETLLSKNKLEKIED